MMEIVELEERLASLFRLQSGDRTDIDDWELMNLGHEAQVAGVHGATVDECARKTAERVYRLQRETLGTPDEDEYSSHRLITVTKVTTLVRAGWVLSDLGYWRTKGT